MNPVPPWALSNWPATGCPGITATQHVMPPMCSTLRGRRSRPAWGVAMFSIATVTAGVRRPVGQRGGQALLQRALAEHEFLRPVEEAAADAGRRRREERELVVEHHEGVPGHRDLREVVEQGR